MIPYPNNPYYWLIIVVKEQISLLVLYSATRFIVVTSLHDILVDSDYSPYKLNNYT